MTGSPRPAIRTPDQRIRVFVSSTLRELAPERAAARTAIEHLRLAPVMFELGARPHPPRDLYRAYLDQSDVFIGIYADSYGWIGPGETISGLEDEYNLAPATMPKLIYVREPADRQERLVELIDRIRDDDTAAYKGFATAEELAELVQSDLAVLLAERFDASRAPADPGAPPGLRPPTASVPPAFSRIIGREAEIARIGELLTSRENRVVTLAGPGGIGKSRLSLAVAEAVGADFPDGAVFVALENVQEPELLLPAIGYALGVRDAADLPIRERLGRALEGRRILLILDNFEQLTDAAAQLVELYSLAPDSAILVTSRTVLRIRGERVFDVPPLATADPDAPDSIVRATRSPAVELLVERARAVKPDFEITPRNEAAVVGVCRALEGLPLAIELAAARMRVLPPAAILERLDRQLALLSDASRDLPERQRTLRSTIDWSASLLADADRTMVRDLAVFASGFSLESVEAFGIEREWGFDALETLERLVDSSLVRQEDVDAFAVFSLPVAVREYGVEHLQASGDEDAARAAHTRVYTDLATRVGGSGSIQTTAETGRLNVERGNLRAAVRHLVTSGDADAAADVAWRLFLYWWVGGYLPEVALWMRHVQTMPAAGPRAQAITTFFIRWAEQWEAATPETVDALREASASFAELGDTFGATMAIGAAGLAEVNLPEPDIALATRWLQEGAAGFRALGVGWGESLVLVVLCRIALLTTGVEAARELVERAVAAASGAGDPFTLTVAMHHLGRVQVFAGEFDAAQSTFAEAARGSLALRHDEGVAFALEGGAAIAAAAGDAERAGLLSGAAAAIRKRVAMFDAAPFVYHTAFTARLQDGATFQAAEARGREMGTAEAARILFDESRSAHSVAESVQARP